MKKITVLAGLLLVAAVSFAQAGSDIRWGITISAGTPPPPVRYEPPPPPRPAHVWVEGYWNWNGTAYVWMPGRWLRARPGYDYAQPRWQEGPSGWELHRGGWRRGNSPERAPHCPPGQRKKGNC